MLKCTVFAAAISLASLTATVPASAQVGQVGVINVAVTDVSILNNSLNKNQIAALNNIHVPITVVAPISVAANVCSISVAVLATDYAPTGAPCTAMSGSQALAKLVNQQVLKQNR
jgi:hypothetical protein